MNGSGRLGKGLLMLVLAGVMPILASIGASACVVPANAAALRAEMIAQINAQRSRAGLPSLSVAPQLERAAQELACDNARRNRLSHADAAGRDIRARLRAVGYGFRMANENIATHASAPAAVQGWMGSRLHRTNILAGRSREIGGGVARSSGGQLFWVMISALPG